MTFPKAKSKGESGTRRGRNGRIHVRKTPIFIQMSNASPVRENGTSQLLLGGCSPCAVEFVLEAPPLVHQPSRGHHIARALAFVEGFLQPLLVAWIWGIRFLKVVLKFRSSLN